MADDKPSVLIIGGLGYIGRHLALHIHKNSLASEVRVVDKVLPQLAWLAPEFEEACAGSKFMQADACREQALARIFDRPNGKEWDYVFNCGGETRFSQEDEVYRLRSLGLSLAVGRESAKRKVKAFVELSTGMVYRNQTKPSTENDKIKPATKVAQYKLQAENELAEIEGLNLIIVRLPNVYGPYSPHWVSLGLCLARVYKSMETDMKWLWTKDMRTYTVHVDDCTRVLWTLAGWYVDGKANWDEATMGKVPIFNVADKGSTTQGIMAELMGQIFGIKMSFTGQLISTFARLNLDSVVEDVNDDVLQPWADLLQEAGITKHGPINPFVEKESLKDTDLSIDASRLEKVVGFVYEKPKITKELLEEVIESYKRMQWWP